jgi:hypothetical protein
MLPALSNSVISLWYGTSRFWKVMGGTQSLESHRKQKAPISEHKFTDCFSKVQKDSLLEKDLAGKLPWNFENSFEQSNG